MALYKVFIVFGIIFFFLFSIILFCTGHWIIGLLTIYLTYDFVCDLDWDEDFYNEGD